MPVEPEAEQQPDEAMRRAERRLLALVEATASFTWVARPDGALTSDMPRWRAITGQSTEELLGDGWLEAIHPDDRERTAGAWRAAVEARGAYAVQYRIRRAAGGWCWLDVRGVPVHDDDGTLLEYMGLCVDISAERELASRLEQERLLLERVVEESPVGIGVLWGRELRYLLVNEEARRLLPPGREVVGRRLVDAIPEAAGYEALLLEVLDTGRPHHLPVVELELPGPGALDGKRYYESRFVPVTDDAGAVAGVLNLAVERTDEVRRRRALEEQLAREREVAHELQRAIAVLPLPDHPALTLAARYRAAGGDLEVGGDWYDAVPLPGGGLALVVGDVAGRGLPAATIMGQARVVARAALAQPGTTPAGALAALHRFVDLLPEPAVLTALIALLDPAAGRLTYARAGHPPALVRAADGAVRLLDASRAPPVGAPGFTVADADAAFAPGETLLLCTDGLVEERGTPIDEGIAAVAAVLAQGGPLEALAERLLATAPSEVDDVALVLARVTA